MAMTRRLCCSTSSATRHGRGPVGGRWKLGVEVEFLAPLPVGHDAEGRLRILSKRIGGDDAPGWEVSESPVSNILLIQLSSAVEP